MAELVALKIPVSEQRPMFYYGNGRRLYIGDVRVEGQNFSFNTNFLLDTGCPISLISEYDLKAKTRLQLKDLKREPQPIGLGLQPYIQKHIGECTLHMRNVDGSDVAFRQDFSAVVKAGVRDGVISLSFSRGRLPSILGEDFLESQGLGLTPRDGNGVRYLFRDRL